MEDLTSMAKRSFILESQRFGRTFEKRLYTGLAEKMLRIIFSQIVGFEQYLEKQHPGLNFSPDNYGAWMRLLEFLKQVDFNQLRRELKVFSGKRDIFNDTIVSLDYLLSSKRVAKILK